MSEQMDDREWFERELGHFVPPDVFDFGVPVAPTPEGLTAESLGKDLSHALFDRLPRMHYAPADTEPATNGYIERLGEDSGFPGLARYIPAADDRVTLRSALEKKRFAGIAVPPTDDLPAALPGRILETINELGRLVLLDVSLSDEGVAWQVAQLCMQYPRAKFVVESAGKYQTLTDAGEGLFQFKDVLNIFFTTAFVTEWQVLESLFAAIEPHRILFSTGGRRALELGKSVIINDYIVEATPEHMKDSEGDTPPFALRLYEELWAIRAAVERLGINRDHILDFFYDNAQQLIEVAIRKP